MTDSATCGTGESDGGGSTLLSIPEQELRDCRDTPEHQAVCMKFAVRRVQQLGFLVPERLMACQNMACKALMLAYDTDVLCLLKMLLDNYERAREERDDLRATDKQQRHEVGRQERRSASLERRLVMQEKKLAEAEYRLQEQLTLVDRLRAEVKREVQKARQAQGELHRMTEQLRHRQQRAEQELFEARQRVEQSDRRLPQPALPISYRMRPPPSRTAAVRPAAAAAAKPALTAQHAAVMASDIFEAVLLPPLNRGRGRKPPGAEQDRSSGLPPPAPQIWYKVPQSGPADNASCGSGGAGAELSVTSVISLAETIDAGGGGCQATADSSAALSVASSSIDNDGRRFGGRGCRSCSDARRN